MVIKMETPIIKIKCPYCGAVLAVKKTVGIETKTLKCPVCKESSPYNGFKQVVNKKREEHTEYPKGHSAASSSDEQMHTKLNEILNYTLGQLKIVNSNVPVFRLKVGKNIVGRKATASTADFQIYTGESKRLSREHLSIEVKKVPKKGFVHYASLCKMKSNATFINADRLEYGECVILQHGDLLKLPDVSIKFEIPDDDGTDL